MKLFSSKLEKVLFHRVRSELRKVPALQKEGKRLARRRQMSSTGIFSAALSGGFWAFGLNRIAERGGGLGAQLAYCTVSSVVLVVWLVIMAYSRLSQPSDANALCNLPISDRDILKREWSLFFRKSTMLIGAFTILFGSVALINQMGVYEWLAIPFLAAIQWIVSLESAVLLAGYGRGFGSRLVPVCGLVSLVLLIFMAVVPRWAPLGYELFRSLGEMPYWIFPTGWSSFLLLQLKAGNFWLMALGLLIIGSYCLLFRAALQKLLSSPVLPGLSFKANPTFVDEETYDALVAELPPDGPELSRPLMPRTEIEDGIYDRSFLKPSHPVALSWVDRINAQLFNPREKMLAEILGLRSGLSGQWKRVAIFICALLFYAKFVSYEPPVILYMVMSLIVAGFGLPLWNPVSRAFVSSTFSGANIPWYAGFRLAFGICLGSF